MVLICPACPLKSLGLLILSLGVDGEMVSISVEGAGGGGVFLVVAFFLLYAFLPFFVDADISSWIFAFSVFVILRFGLPEAIDDGAS